jgi:hypothetical protein
MQLRVHQWLMQGKDVRIFTARVCDPSRTHVVEAIEAWCVRHLGRKLPVTCSKDYHMTELWDDRAVQIIPNTGQRADGRS